MEISKKIRAYDELVAEDRVLYPAYIKEMNDNSLKETDIPAIPAHYILSSDTPEQPEVSERIQNIMIREGVWNMEYCMTVAGCPGGKEMYQNYKLPGQIFFYDFLAAACALVSRDAGRDGKMTGIEAVWRYYIENEETVKTILGIFTARRFRDQEWVEVKAGSDEFAALLATQHGKSIARMLAQYPVMFGRRMLSRARLFPQFSGRTMLEERPDICWIIEQIAPPKLSKKEQREQKAAHKRALSEASASARSEGTN
ncbi:hypothetical protein V8F06_009165 [Rhypophila decipiens]